MGSLGKVEYDVTGSLFNYLDVTWRMCKRATVQSERCWVILQGIAVTYWRCAVADSVRILRWHMLAHLPSAHTRVCWQVEWVIPAFTPQPSSISTLCPILIFHPTENRRLRLAWVACYILRWSVWQCPPIPVLIGADVE